MADQKTSATLLVAWDGASPATAPANSTLVLGLYNDHTVGFELTGTFSATILLEATIDGVTWFTPNTFTVARAAGATSFTGAGRCLIQATGYTEVRARCSAYVSGSPAVTLTGSLAGI